MAPRGSPYVCIAFDRPDFRFLDTLLATSTLRAATLRAF